MSETRHETPFSVECPHCHKTFTGATIGGARTRYRGFKCPHCKLFVPLARASERDLVEPLTRDTDADRRDDVS